MSEKPDLSLPPATKLGQGNILPPAKLLGQGNVFTVFCDSVNGGVSALGLSAPGVSAPRGVSGLVDVCSQGVSALGGLLLGGVPGPGGVPGKVLPPCGQTHACKHITLPQTLFAGGN